MAVKGSATDSASAMHRFVDRLDSDGDHPLIGTGRTADPIRAAMGNAVAAHSIEYDDVHNASSSHPGVVVFPAAIAGSQISGAEIEDFVLAVFRGYEVMCRVGRAANPQAHYERHFHPTGTIGHFGAATAAASLLGLDVEQTVSAVGIAATMASGSMQFLLDGAWTKRFHPAHAARDGIEAALMAEGDRSKNPRVRRFVGHLPTSRLLHLVGEGQSRLSRSLWDCRLPHRSVEKRPGEDLRSGDEGSSGSEGSSGQLLGGDHHPEMVGLIIVLRSAVLLGDR